MYRVQLAKLICKMGEKMIYIYDCLSKSSVRNNFLQLSGNFCVKIATQIMNCIAIFSN